ncbi:KAP family P-loop NTPase fold protein [Sinorhizobium fredii]|uniref:KAP P-loop domain-containing protein n=1 Tax=Rhizobium fredii TaxID=380 RepID=A0A2L0H929_RHIFR|nr:P-loop NTPase fold protein [Sinorhizobium fredii]AUX77988.1 KAP P-loop domain-containing protein [Sinorhizobium fredii]
MTGAIAKGLLKKHTGVSLDELTDIVADEGTLADAIETAVDEGSKAVSGELEKLFDSSLEALIEGFQRTNQATTDFREKLQISIAALSAEKNAPFFVLVDELDRCRPTYAVQLLERVKHLFDVEGVIFVFATNSDQLQHSIAGAYGPGFDGFRYLKRFFDRTYVFDKPSIENMVESLCANLPKAKLKAPEDRLSEAIALGCKAFDLDLRAVVQVVEMIDATATAWPHELPADISLVLPACAHFYLSGKAEWPQTALPALKRWVIERFVRRNFEGKTVDRSIKFGEIYAHATSIFRSLEEVRNDRRRSGDSIAADYVASVFDGEHNGIQVDPKKPSIQTEILGIVANAGRMMIKTSDNV